MSAAAHGRTLSRTVLDNRGYRETDRLFLLMDAESRTVRGFIPKTGRSDLPSDAELGRLIRERIRAAIS
jgi:hypothetical protein